MKLDAQGWFSGMRRVRSPNFDARPPHTRISLLVIHSISLPPEEFGGPGVEQLFTNTLNPDGHPYYEKLRDLKVSSHFFVRRDGSIVQYVSCLHRAWHAGASQWKEKVRCNDFSIGIELEGSDSTAYTDAQYRSLSSLTRRLKRAFPIQDIAGHVDIAPARKTDPGPYFEWPRYLRTI